MTITVLDPSKLPGAPKTLPKGWGAADWDVPDGTDVVAALRGAVTVTSAPTVELVPIDPTYPTEIILPPAIIALEPDRGIPLPAGDVGILAGQGGERKSTLTIQMAVAAARCEWPHGKMPLPGSPSGPGPAPSTWTRNRNRRGTRACCGTRRTA